MVRVAHFADLHLSTRRDDSLLTIDEQEKLIIDAISDAHSRGCELFLFAGDTFHATSNVRERLALSNIVGHLKKLSVKFLFIRGNHDTDGDMNPLVPRDNYVDQFAILYLSDCSIIAIPHFSIARARSIDVDPNQVLSNLLLSASVKADLKKDLPVIIIAHGTVSSARSDNGQPMIARPGMVISEGDLRDTGADYIAMGHIHKRQHTDHGGKILCYAGSPRQTTFGEDVGKGYVIADVQRGKSSIEYIDLPSPELHTIDIESLDQFNCDKPKGSILKLRYTCDRELRSQSFSKLRELSDRLITDGNARHVEIDLRTNQSNRNRSPEMTKAKSNSDRLSAYSAIYPHDQIDSIKTKLTEIENAN